MTNRSMTSPLGHLPVLSSEGTPHCGEEAPASTKTNEFSPISFERPFDDYRLEPLPLREEHQPKLGPLNQHLTADQVVLLSSEEHRNQASIQVKNLKHEDLGGTSSGTSWSSSENSLSGLVGSPPVAADESVARFRRFQDEKWQVSFQRLLEFKRKRGHCCVPRSYTEDQALARWVKRQRHQYKKFKDNDPTSTLTSSRLEQLEAIGFVWHSHAAAWMEKLNELKAFRAKKGHCNVPSTYPENVALSTWVKSERRQYKLYVSGSSSTMTTLRFRVLKSLGFVFEPRLGASKNAGLELQR